ncbi:MAG: DUF2398 family protein, partial [Frankiaceae bacterium]
VDAALPRAGSLQLLTVGADPDGPDPDLADEPDDPRDDAAEATATCPFLDSGWLAATTNDIVARYGSGFSADMRADPARLLAGALDLLASLRLVERVDTGAGPAGGIRVLPLLARYRNAVVSVRARQTSLFDSGESS